MYPFGKGQGKFGHELRPDAFLSGSDLKAPELRFPNQVVSVGPIEIAMEDRRRSRRGDRPPLGPSTLEYL